MKLSTKSFTLGLAVLLSTSIFAQDLPKPSPTATTTERVGLTDVEIVYSRPGVKDRKIFGDLVPYGEMWRTGANKATAITFSTDVKINGNDLGAGTYAIFTVPGESEWEIIFNNNTEQWGTYAHKDEEDVLKVKVASKKAEFRESMLMFVDDIRDESASINLHWENTLVSIPFSVEVKDVAKMNIDAAIKEAEGRYSTYNSSARYYLDNNMDAAKALEWAQKSVDMQKKYWNLTTLSRAQAANGDYKTAIKTSEEAEKLATEANSKGYIKQNVDNRAAWEKMK